MNSKDTSKKKSTAKVIILTIFACILLFVTSCSGKGGGMNAILGIDPDMGYTEEEKRQQAEKQAETERFLHEQREKQKQGGDGPGGGGGC